MHRPRALALAAVSVLCLLGLSASPASAGAVVPLTTQIMANGLNRPVYVTHAPGDPTRLYIVEQRGVIKVLDLNTLTVNATQFLNIDAITLGPISGNDERGLLGMAFHPDFQANGFFYLYYINNSQDTVVARYSITTPDVANAGSAQTIITFDQPNSNHNGGWIGFSPNDGYLYIATGDGGNFCDQGTGHPVATGNAQDVTNNKLGKLLRIIPSTTAGVGGYTIPGDNPFVGFSGDDEIWSYGLRNPWRCSFDRETGDVYIGDVGQDAREEIDFQPGNSTGRENYGWRCFEGNSCSNISGCPTTPCGCNSTGLDFPIHTYTHALGFSVTGGYVYRGCDIPSLDGTYFFADFGTARIWSFMYDGTTMTEFTDRTNELDPALGAIGSIASFGEDADGEIYIVDRAGTTNGEVWKIVPVTKLADFDCDGLVGITDFLKILGLWGTCPQANCPWDLNGDGEIGIDDFLIVLGTWGPV